MDLLAIPLMTLSICLAVALIVFFVKKTPPVIPIPLRDKESSLLYQYIADAHTLVIQTIGIDPLRDPVEFHTKLWEHMSEVTAKIEVLRQSYVATIAQDTEFGKTLQNYDYWLKGRSAWLAKKSKPRLVK